MSAYRSPQVPPPCECATGPLHETTDDDGSVLMFCGPCIERIERGEPVELHEGAQRDGWRR